jgi:hypothetical protein
MHVNTETRVGRMLDGVVQSENKGAKLVVTVSLYNEAERRYHEPFQIRGWDGRDGRMLTVSVHGSGDWAKGVKPISVIHVDAVTGKTFTARDPRNEDNLLRYAAQVALDYALTGEVPSPKNGRVEAEEWTLCGRCGRELTHPDSIALGIGPECRGQANKGETILAKINADVRRDAAAAANNGAQRTAEQDEADGTDVFGAPDAEPTGSQLLRQMSRTYADYGAGVKDREEAE